ncbi:MAG: tetratricopeptide repeat protein [Pyrinomonadaceae bacterium]
MEGVGDYEAARQIMGELWQRVGERPNLQWLEPEIAAELLMRAGTLTGWLGSKNQVTEAQETAKNLITEAITIFESLSYGKKIAEAQIELAYCYWRQGAYDEARDVLKDALSRLSTDSELKAKAILRMAIVERGAARLNDALHILTDNAPLFEKIKSHAIKGGYHNALAGVLEDLGISEQRQDYLDRAFIEYTAASYHFERASHKPYRAHVQNNLGYLYFKVHRFKEAHIHLDSARRLLLNLKNYCSVAQVDETRARIYLAEKRYAEAEKAACSSVRMLKAGGQQGILADALITHGRTLARLGFYDKAYSKLQRAIKAAHESGAVNRAGEAALAIIEELGDRLTLQRAQDTYAGSGLNAVRQYERNLIKEALDRTEGRVTQAARLLGTSHQHLAYIIKHRHKGLLSARTPIKPRKKPAR